ncbi:MULTISPECIES: hypothetical protein [unclassified Sporolactobacillus]|uniref:hypothetical protein n=1 Tax=unclassified Sporolactobacillus TaxID=2628533 RepID=UPI002368C5ED|nr:hypothetical protein [Sporolactobacillus sp. CQH2019]MDD9147219.1 hypothetical protein [Sporolactobacillus sp. CQH2019]
MILVIGSLFLAAVLINQLREIPLTGRLYRQPLALLLFSGYSLSILPALPPADWCIIAASFLLSFGLGLIQGRYTPLVNHNGAWYLSGSVMAVLVWFLSIPIRYALKYASVHFLSLAPSLNGSSSFVIYFIFMAGFLLGRYTMLLFRYPALVKKAGQNEQRIKKMEEAR